MTIKKFRTKSEIIQTPPNMQNLIIFALFVFASCDYPLRKDWRNIPPVSAALRPRILKSNLTAHVGYPIKGDLPSVYKG